MCSMAPKQYRVAARNKFGRFQLMGNMSMTAYNKTMFLMIMVAGPQS